MDQKNTKNPLVQNSINEVEGVPFSWQAIQGTGNKLRVFHSIKPERLFVGSATAQQGELAHRFGVL